MVSFLQKSLVFLLGLFSAAMAAGDEFNSAMDILEQGSQAGQRALGMGIVWGLIIFFFVAVFGGLFAGYKIESKKVEQEQGTGKLYMVMGIGATIAVFVYILIVMLFSKVITGDVGFLFNSIWTFIKSSVSGTI